MEKRIFAAIVISLAFLWLWAAVAPKLFPELARKPEPPKPAATSTASPAPASATTTAAAPVPAATSTTSTSQPGTTNPTLSPSPAAQTVAAEREQISVVDHPKFTAKFSNRGAQLVSFQLKDYQRRDGNAPVDLVQSRAAGRTDYPFQIVSGNQDVNRTLNSALYAVTDRSDRGRRILEYRYASGGVSATKTFTFSNDQPYLYDFTVAVAPALPYRLTIGPGIRNLGANEQETSAAMVGNGVLQRDGKFKVIPRDKGDRLEVFDSVQYIGVEDNYFLSILRPTRGREAVFQRFDFFDSAKKNARRTELYAGVNAAADGSVAGQAFFGPKETALLDSYGLDEALQFGWFGIIARFFLSALVWINTFTKNYGFAIIVLTILIKIVLYPLQHKSIVSMKKMQRVQPKVEAIKAKYKKARTDPEQRQKMNVEMMQLYQKEGINPMAGCLPIVLQLPILWGFYNLLARAIELRGAPWILWIRDLSEKDPTYVLPILMTATMFIQTYITPSTGDPMQRRIFLIMPLVFGFLFKDFASGLVLYWLVQNVLTIIQQMIMNKWWKDHPQELQTT